MQDSQSHTVEQLPNDQNRFRPSRGLLKLARDRHGYYQTDEFAKAMGKLYTKGSDLPGQVSADTIRNLWKNPSSAVNKESIKALIDFLNLHPDDFISDVPRPYYLDAIPVPEVYSEGEPIGDRKMLYPGHIDDGRHATEMKLVLAEDARDLSEALLAGDSPPSLYEVLRKLRFLILPSAKIKDLKMTELPYNHFVSVSVVVHYDLPNSLKGALLGYERRPSAESKMSNLQTKGLSTLWNSAFPINVKGIHSLMDYWLRVATRDPGLAHYDMMERPYPWVLRVVDHKISLYGYPRHTTEPLGVITTDMRGLGKDKVYTQYVFYIELALPQDDLDRAIKYLYKYGDYE
ncbi:MAG: hypothetical protein ACE37H_07990 [Phycisphaeraceae bacterium]